MKRVMLTAALALGLAAPAQAAMTLGEFLTKANALQAKGAMALFSRDLKPVMDEMKTAFATLRVEGERRKAAGLPPRACPPAGTKLGTKELLAMLNAVPPADRMVSVKDGLLRAMTTRFPCR